MSSRLRKSEFERWLAGQRESEKVIEKERVQFLKGLSTDQAWKLYLSLADNKLLSPTDASEPSYVLTAMRRVLDRCSRKKRLSA